MGFISRQTEKIYKSVLFRRHDPDGSIFYFSHKDFPNLNADEFSFTSKRGHLLRGNFYYYSDPIPERLVVFEHGMGNGHNAYFREIETLAKQGYVVYSYDHTGCNKSEGEHIYGLSGSLSDLDDCISALVNERGYSEEKISVVGHSWGGFSALNILAFHPNIHSIVAMSGFISIKVMQRQAIPRILAPWSRNLFALEKSVNPLYAEISAQETLSKAKSPVLVIHSVDDATVNYKTNILALTEVANKNTNIELCVVKGSGHSPLYTPEAFAYKETFFKELIKARKRKELITPEQKKSFVSKYDWYKMTEQNKDLWNKVFIFLDK